VAVLLTKALSRSQFQYLRTILMLGHRGKGPGVSNWETKEDGDE
jgi:hypothetical protein